MDEFTLIDRYFKHECHSANVSIGIGDDCALVNTPDGYELAFSIDTLIPGVHFFAQGDPALIGQRAMRVALSDLAAMGAEPLCCTLALVIPRADELWLKSFSSGLLEAARCFQCDLVGGDTVKGPLTISVQVHGFVPKGQALTRDGAGVGDMVCVTGSLGDGAAALRVLKGDINVSSAAFAYFTDCYYLPEPRIDIGKKIRGLASAAIDISDGLLADLGHICRASGVGATLDLSNLPISSPFAGDVSNEERVSWALSGGDDYQLCFTVPENRSRSLFQLINARKCDITVIGRIVGEQGIHCQKSGESLTSSNVGYRHFD